MSPIRLLEWSKSVTQQQKEQISKLRANGASFGKIASALGISINTIKSYPYFVWWDHLESIHLWIGCKDKFCRCVRARMKNLKYDTDEDAAMILSPGEQIWGYPHVLEYRHPFHFSRMYVVEKWFESENELLEDLKNYDGSIELRGWLDELFGDG